MTDTLLRESEPTNGYQPVPKPQYWDQTANNSLGGWKVLEGDEKGMFVVPNTARKQDAVISAGQRESTPVCIANAEHIALIFPDAFTGAEFAFAVSDTENGTYRELWNGNFPMKTPLVGSGGAMYGKAVSPHACGYLKAWQYVKIVADEVQAQQRTFGIHMK